MCNPTDKGPILVLEDPFGTIISEPVPNISNEEANELVGKILFLTMTLFPNINKCTISAIRKTNLGL